ncbi:MAG: hypothetical protein RBU30_10420 [Polyangia bacterium]|jgi:hypothetical protein|nr:hypothetical protein [Polyangia bacterium]
MRRPPRISLGALAALGLLVLGSCDREPSCKLLHKRIRKCGSDQGAGLSEGSFVKLCEKRRDRPGTRAQIACSREPGCKAFTACLARARDLDRQALLERRWEEVQKAISEGGYSKAFTFCDVRKDELKGVMRERCERLPGQAIAALRKELTDLRDRGAVPEKATRCWELKRVAQRVGAEARRAADDLCHELEASRHLIKARKEVSESLGAEQPFLTYHCHLLRLKDVVAKVRSPYTEKVQAQLVELCLKTLGKAILAKRVPTQQRCEVRETFDAIRELGVKDPGLDPLVEQAKKHCETRSELP